ncbi:1-aminocyclopropane-1-carboxylate oxidase [Citrus sinensis]|nr:1-aminocyclopropane-1-carboxylate oxidase [Citrus sinensis]
MLDSTATLISITHEPQVGGYVGYFYFRYQKWKSMKCLKFAGLKPEYLKDMICFNLYLIVCNYYPHCPQPELTLGARRHSDPSFLTILLQDQICGLQVFHENQWIDVHPISGDLVVNIGGFLQVISNNKLKSVDHRVVANVRATARVAVACFFTGHATEVQKPFGPIKELQSKCFPSILKKIHLFTENF